MSVEVADQGNFPLSFEVSHHALNMPVDWVKRLRRYLPPSIQVLSCQTAPIVAIDYTVWIEHRHDLEYKIFSQRLRFRRITDEKLDDSLHHPACIRLARVDSRRDEYAFLGFRFLTIRISLFRRDRDILTSIAGQCPAQRAPIDKVLREAVPLDPRQIITQISVSVWEAVSEVHLIVVLSEGMREGQSEVASAPPITLTLERICIVTDVVADTMPRELLRTIP